METNKITGAEYKLLQRRLHMSSAELAKILGIAVIEESEILKNPSDPIKNILLCIVIRYCLENLEAIDQRPSYNIKDMTDVLDENNIEYNDGLLAGLFGKAQFTVNRWVKEKKPRKHTKLINSAMKIFKEAVSAKGESGFKKWKKAAREEAESRDIPHAALKGWGKIK